MAPRQAHHVGSKMKQYSETLQCLNIFLIYNVDFSGYFSECFFKSLRSTPYSLVNPNGYIYSVFVGLDLPPLAVATATVTTTMSNTEMRQNMTSVTYSMVT